MKRVTEQQGNMTNQQVRTGACPPPAAFVVNDDPTQILDVMTTVEQEGEACGADIDINRFVYEPGDFSLGTAVLDALLVEANMTTTKECDTHEYD